MGCINSITKIKVKSIEFFQKKIEKNIKQDESEELSNKFFIFSDSTIEDTNDSNSSDDQSQILAHAQTKNNELIFS